MLDRSGKSIHLPTLSAGDTAPSHFYAVAAPSSLAEMLAEQTCRAVHTRPAPPEQHRTAECRFPMKTLVVLGGEMAVVPEGVRYLGSVVHLGIP